MLLFKEQHIPLILSGQKTQTRRLWPKGKRVNVGSIQQARTKMLDSKSTFAYLEIKRVWQEELNDISHADAQAEGYDTGGEYIQAFMKINRIPPSKFDEALTMKLWCVEFVVL